MIKSCSPGGADSTRTGDLTLRRVPSFIVVANVSALKIHMSENAHEALEAFPEFITETRGEIAVKVTVTYFYILEATGLESQQNFSSPSISTRVLLIIVVLCETPLAP